MRQDLHSPEVYDYRQYDRIWQRVAPDLEPYPGVRDGAAGRQSPPPQPVQPPAQQPPQPVQPPAQQPPQPVQPPAQQPSQPPAQLPGADPDPCCMGTAASEMLDVLTGFIEEELADRRAFLALSRRAPLWAQQRLREIAADEGAHAKQLMAVHYLVTGQCYRPVVPGGTPPVGRWCPALRERYHLEACNALNYARSADGTTDPCLSKLLTDLSEDEYRHADILMGLLERSL